MCVCVCVCVDVWCFEGSLAVMGDIYTNDVGEEREEED